MGKKKKVTVMGYKKRGTDLMDCKAVEKLKWRIQELEEQAEGCKEYIRDLQELIKDCKRRIRDLAGQAEIDSMYIEGLEAQLEADEKEGVDSDGQRN